MECSLHDCLDGLQTTFLMGRFSLLAPRGQVSNEDKEAVFNELGQDWTATIEDLMDYTDFDEQTVSSSLMAYIQAGRVVYDLDKGLYQKRELTQILWIWISYDSLRQRKKKR